MEDRERDEQGIMSLKNGEEYTVPGSDYGHAEIWLIHDCYFVFSIPIYGGRPVYEKAIPPLWNKEKQVKKVLDLIDTWT